MWVNSPANPTGQVLAVEHLRKVVSWCRDRGTLLVSDECYLECTWEGERPLSVLHPDVCGGVHEGILALHSLSKRSNLAGYRCGFVAGDPAVVAELLAVRKNLGLMLPGPQQVAMAAALADDAHADEQRARYAARRTTLRAALQEAGFRVDHSEGSLYLWATRDQDCWQTVADLAGLGILVAPGTFYGPGQPARAGGAHRHRRAAPGGGGPTSGARLIQGRGSAGVPRPRRRPGTAGGGRGALRASSRSGRDRAPACRKASSPRRGRRHGPIARAPVRVLGEVAPGAVRRRQDDARRPVRSDHPAPHGAEPRTVDVNGKRHSGVAEGRL